MSSMRARSSVRRIVVFGLTGLLLACTKDPTGPAADPVGTVTSAIRTAGNGAYQLDFDLGTVTTTNPGGTDLYLDANVNFNANSFVSAGQQPRRVADVGTVGGLGNVTAVPTAGFSTTVAAIVGHGYVLQDNGRNWRFYVTSVITGATTGGVIGVNIKWTSM